jgi:hypothetical protein
VLYIWIFEIIAIVILVIWFNFYYSWVIFLWKEPCCII